MTKTNVLVVDNDRSMRDLLGIILREEGFWVAEVSNSAQALHLAKNVKFDLILADLSPLKGSSLQHLEAFAQASPETPLIIMTTDPSEVKVKYPLVRTVIPKPFDLNQLLKVVEQSNYRPELDLSLK